MRQTPAERQALYRKRHPERIAAYKASPAAKILNKAWREANQKRLNAMARAKYVKKPERPAFDEKAWRAEWRERNRDWYLARSAQYAAARRTIVKRATPAWANKFFIGEIYHLSQLRSKYLGVPHDVDHIVPLQSPVVCGLHVEHNLRVVPRRENIRKGNLLLDNLAVPVGVSCRGYEGGI